MNTTSKLTLAFTLLFALLLLSLSAWQLQRYLALQERETDEQLTVLARALESAGEELWRLDGESAARAYIERRDDARARTRITVERPSAELIGAPLDVETARLVDEDGRATLQARALLDGPEGSQLLLQLTRSIEPERAYTREALAQQLALTLLFTGAAGLLTWLIGRRVIGAPLDQLVAHARSIGAGRLSSRLSLRRRSEFSVLAHEMNLMAEALRRADAEASSEAEKRMELLDQLRHADRLSSIGKLAAAVAHELGTPLNVVSGHATMIKMDADASPAVATHADAIVDRVRHMTRLIKQMMSFARHRGVKRGLVSVDATLREAVSFVSLLAKRHGVAIVIEESVDERVPLDEQRVMQMLTNLIVNAIHASPEGGSIYVGARRCDDVKPPGGATKAPWYLRLRVRDEGGGMTPEQLEHAFEPFFTTKGEGTGLGLPICHGIVEDHGGWIAPRSAPGEGACFDCFFPLSEGDGEAA